MTAPGAAQAGGAADASGTSRPQPDHTEPVPAQWRAAESRLYPLITADPAAYEAAVMLVSEAADALRARCDTVADLARVDGAQVLAECRSAGDAVAMGVDPSLALDAARALCWRRLDSDRRPREPGHDQPASVVR